MKKQIITTLGIIILSSMVLGQSSRMGSASSTQLLVVPSARRLETVIECRVPQRHPGFLQCQFQQKSTTAEIEVSISAPLVGYVMSTEEVKVRCRTPCLTDSLVLISLAVRFGFLDRLVTRLGLRG